ncbi:MAG: hypothetical protein MJ204_07250 [Bacteroidales bacterium]|nr:hypothetical protein [Bacteroidales bacterium]
MAKKLSKISKELRVGISVIAEFLNNNGYDCEENPNEKIPEEAIEFLRNNISAYIQETETEKNEIITKSNDSSKFVLETPVEIKLIDCVSKNKLLIENIIGFTDYTWDYSVAKFHGVCSQPVKFTVFDEIISKILLHKEMSLAEIGAILGFNISDDAEKSILSSAISDLRNDKMLEGDDSYLFLTDTGKQYAKNGVKFLTFEKDFELYIDSTAGFNGNCRRIFERLKSQKQESFVKTNLPRNIEDVKPLAEIQAPEIHFPSKNYILQSCQPTGIDGYKAQVWVVLLENFREQTVRAIVYDENRDCIIEELSDALNSNEELKQSILEKLIEKDKNNTEGISYTNEDKDDNQVKVEASLISVQEEYDNALTQNDLVKAEEIVKTVSSSKRHFNSVEFEVELKRLFEDTKCDLWIISPWIKKYATQHRLPFFEQYLKKGGRIFIAYSKPENGFDEMADPEALEKLIELEKKYQNFYINQLDPFHFKYVWVRGATEGDWFYSGSFNILSFYVKKGLTKVRQEMMTKIDWGSEEDEYFSLVLATFGRKYLNAASETLSNYHLENISVDRKLIQEIKGINFNKLKPFASTISEEFDNELLELQIKQEDLLQQVKQDFFKQEITSLQSLVLKYSEDTNLSIEKKKEVQSKLNTLKNEYPDNLEEMVEVQSLIDSLKAKDLSRLAKPKTFNNKGKNKFKKKR